MNMTDDQRNSEAQRLARQLRIDAQSRAIRLSIRRRRDADISRERGAVPTLPPSRAADAETPRPEVQRHPGQ